MSTIPVQPPYNTNPAASGTWIPQLWSGKLNAKFYATTVFGEIANTDYEGDIKSLGDTVWINNIPTITISDYAIGTQLNYQVPAPSVTELQINKAKWFGAAVNDVIAYQSQVKLMDTFTSDASKQMAITIDRDILLNSALTPAAANQGATAGALTGSYNLGTAAVPITISSSNVIPMISAFASVLDEQNIPDTDRFLIISPYFRYQLMQSPLAQAYVTGDSASILRNGKIGTIDRFTIYVSNLLPKQAVGQDLFGNTAGGNAKAGVIFAGHKSAITFASQIAKMETLPNPNDFGEVVRGLNVYGYATIQPLALSMAYVV